MATNARDSLLETKPTIKLKFMIEQRTCFALKINFTFRVL
jgi:hypothetical protein